LLERGALLHKLCAGKLTDAEEKLAKLTLDGDGKPTGTAPLDG
jgi:exodeoxyribonuclease VII small subunit